MPLKLCDLNEHLTCKLCGGYFIDATTIIECLHSFCRSCIVTYLATNKCCPRCEIPAHKTRPLLNIRSDKTLQDVVYKIVPDLYDKEWSRKKRYHEENGIPIDEEEKKTAVATPEKKDHRVSLSIEYDNRDLVLSDDSPWFKENAYFPKRFLRCFDTVCVSTINKLIRKKVSRDDIEVITFCRGEVLPETYALMDVAKTFSWKSDRPLTLTYMTFASKNRKRKALDIIENEIETREILPAKKIALGIDDTTERKALVVSTITENISAKKEVNENRKRLSFTAGQLPRPVDLKPKLPTLAPKPTIPKPFSPPTSKTQVISQNGSKNMSYSVMNVPLLEAVPASEAARHVANKVPSVSRNFTTPQSNGLASSFVPQHTQAHERKSINSIANRLQIQRQMQHERISPEKTIPSGVNLPDVLKAATQTPPKPPPQIRSSWKLSDGTSTLPSAKMQRNLMAQRINASTLQSQRRDSSPDARTLERMQKAFASGASGAQSSVPNRGRPPFSPTTSHPSNFVRLQRTNEPPNYSQATEQQRKLMFLQQQRLQLQKQQQARSKYQEIQPKVPVRLDARRVQTQPSRMQKQTSMEDSQLLSTTRQLATLRQQQKLLNQIAAAVRGQGNPMRMGESIRAAVNRVASSSPRMTSPRMPSMSPRATVTSTKSVPTPRAMVQMASSSHQQRFPIIAPNRTVQNAPRQIPGVGNALRPVRPTGTSFSEVSKLPHNIGVPSLNSRRDGGMDIYQNTIARAKAQVREMSMKDRVAPRSRPQIRSAAAPYNIPGPSAPRKLPPKPVYTRPPFPSSSRHVPIAPKPTPHASNYRGLTTRPPPPPPKFNPMSNSQRPRQILSVPPPRTSHSVISQVRPPVTLPEQDQPLCLVVKK